MQAYDGLLPGSAPMREQGVPRAMEWAGGLAWLGTPALMAYARHRVLLGLGFSQWRLGRGGVPVGPFFGRGAIPTWQSATLPPKRLEALRQTGEALRLGRLTLWGGVGVELGSPPDWHRDPLSGEHARTEAVHGLALDLFAGADIRGQWEVGRAHWAPQLAALARITGDEAHRDRLELWLASFLAANVPFRGAHWACGQEAALRLLHLAAAASILEGPQPPRRPALGALLVLHLRRISASGSYARAQANNHLLSESCARFVGGALTRDGRLEAEGRRGLEHSARLLFTEQGCFSQASTRYQRMALDLLSAAEWWRRRLGRPAFSDRLRKRAAGCLDWLALLADPATGALPRIGHDDGTALFAFTPSDTEDCRPTLVRAAAVFGSGTAFRDPLSFWMGQPEAAVSPPPVLALSSPLRTRRPGPQPHPSLRQEGARPPRLVGGAELEGQAAGQPDRDVPPMRRDLEARERQAPLGAEPAAATPDGVGIRAAAGTTETGWTRLARSMLDPQAGFAVRRDGRSLFLLRGVPRRFRLAHADLLHLELWPDGVPLVTDGGTYLYHPGRGREWLQGHLPGTEAHATITFDRHDQVPRLGRFLFGRPPASLGLESGQGHLEGGYRDRRGRSHHRLVEWQGSQIRIEDRIDGRWTDATLRWRLAGGFWAPIEQGAWSPRARVTIEADRAVTTQLAQGVESLGYGRVRPLPVLTSSLSEGGRARIVTTIELAGTIEPEP